MTYGMTAVSQPSSATPRSAVRRTRRVLLLTGLLVVGGTTLFLAALRLAGPPPTQQIPWWILAAAFAATELWVVHIQFGREAKSISISEIPLVVALFCATPGDLMLAKVVGPAAVVLLYRRQTALKSALNLSLFYANGAVALFAFTLLSGGSTHDGLREWFAAVVAATLAIVVDLLVLTLILSWYTEVSARDGLRGSWPAVVMAAASATIGIVAVLTLRLGPLAAIPLLASGVALMLAYRAYSRLSDRHTSLERLFSFSRELSGAPATTNVLPAVLGQARQLLRAEVVEVFTLPRPGGTGGLWRYDGERVVSGGGDDVANALTVVADLVAGGQARLLNGAQPGAAGFLKLRGAGEAVIAPLVVDGETVGAIAAYDRQGEVRGFAETDVTLLKTVANHASMALHNESLIGRLRHEAMHDTLTGLPNRAQLMALTTAAVQRAASGQSRVAMIIIDLNGFKAVNDTLGHQVGDVLITEVGRRLSDASGPGVTVARLGGDEFAVLVEPAEDDAVGVAERMCEALLEPMVVGQERLHLAGSMGVALAPDHATTVSDLLRRADIAMYAAKNGPDNVVVYRPDIDLNDPSLLSLTAELRSAIAEGQVAVEVEPVLDLLTGRVVAAEALVRWHHPTRGKLAPGVFLPLAERNGLIAPLTERVLDDAVRACAAWQVQGLPIGISVNLSTRSLLDQTLPRTVSEVLSRHQLPAHLLTLEITESIVISDEARALALLGELRALGVRLALDDFGTGYSSLTYLSALPIQQLKIDRSFVARIIDSSRDAAIVTSLIDLSHHLGLQVIAEGIEEVVVRDRLRKLGCEYGQGYLFARSMDPAALVEWAETPTNASRTVRGAVESLMR
jgi:diguanylate cyclase (GGDEF)-like protein